jgi:hypothetical protein
MFFDHPSTPGETKQSHFSSFQNRRLLFSKSIFIPPNADASITLEWPRRSDACDVFSMKSAETWCLNVLSLTYCVCMHWSCFAERLACRLALFWCRLGGPPTTTCCLPPLPAAFHDYLLPPTTACCLPPLPAPSQDYLPPPTTTCCQPLVPRIKGTMNA